MTTAQRFNTMRVYVDAESIADGQLEIGFIFSDTGEHYSLDIRNSILDSHTSLVAATDATLSLERAALDRLINKQISYVDAITTGKSKVDGSKLALLNYAKAFDTEPANPCWSLQ